MIRDRANQPSKRLPFVEPSSTRRTLFDMCYDACCVVGAQLVIDVRIDQTSDLVTRHDASPIADAGSSTASSRSRARASLDITVPIGMPTTAAISLYES